MPKINQNFKINELSSVHIEDQNMNFSLFISRLAIFVNPHASTLCLLCTTRLMSPVANLDPDLSQNFAQI